jgi:2-dehydropantoate 2-reductase
MDASKPAVCIVGAGAVGSTIGGRLAAAGACTVSAWARGQTLQALRRDGWRWTEAPAVAGPAEAAPAPEPALERHARLQAAGSPAELGPQDLVVIAVKAPALGEIARSIAPLLGPATVVLPAVNGVPWWFSPTVEGLLDRPLRSVDPDGALASRLPAEHVLGCVVHFSARRLGPGRVEHLAGRGLIVGDPLRRRGPTDPERRRAHERVTALLRGAGFEVTESADIQRDLWFKLWGNLTMNPVSALTGATTDRLLDDDLVRGFCSQAMLEAAQVGARIGCRIDTSPEERHAVTRQLGAFKTSMLQDAEAGRPLELDAIVGAVREIAQRVGVPTPSIDVLYGLIRLFAQAHRLSTQAAATPSG